METKSFSNNRCPFQLYEDVGGYVNANIVRRCYLTANALQLWIDYCSPGNSTVTSYRFLLANHISYMLISTKMYTHVNKIGRVLYLICSHHVHTPFISITVNLKKKKKFISHTFSTWYDFTAYWRQAANNIYFVVSETKNSAWYRSKLGLIRVLKSS